MYPNESYEELKQAAQVSPCRHLLSKGMFLTGQVVPDPEGSIGDGYCWCALTQHALGPDDKMVERKECKPGRSCYSAVL